ncbi:MAG: GGDEF domain-containing protein [Pleurocapsa sp.]
MFATAEVLIVSNVSGKYEFLEVLKDLAKSSFVICLGVALFLFKQSEQYEISRLHRKAFRDILTGLYNYAFFCQSGKQKFLEAKRSKSPLSIMMLDIDNFKAYNDKFGHQAGNVALRCFAKELKHITRDYDLVARYGGEEFVVLVNSNLDEAFNLAQRICYTINTDCTPKSYPELCRSITVSIGLASVTGSINKLEELIEAADLELYRAKKAGKNRVHFLHQPHNLPSQS